jgi:mycoredoxin
MEKIIVYGTRWCGDTRRALKVLDAREIDYDWINIDKDAQGEQFVKETNQGKRSVPTIVFPDESILVEPSNKKLNEKLDALNL